jgi:hypothetical protein
MSDIRVNEIKGRSGATAPTLSSGAKITGIATIAGYDLNLSNPAYNAIGATITQEGNATFAGIASASSFYGDGSTLTGVSGFATALSSDTSSFLNQVFKTTSADGPGAGTSVTITSDATSGNLAFTRLGQINVGTGATLHVSTGVTFVTDVLSIF